MRALPLRIASLLGLLFSAMAAVGTYAQQAAFCAPGSGCDQVQRSIIGEAIGVYLPALGLLTYTVTFVGSLVERRRTQQLAALVAVAGGLGGVALLVLQSWQIHAWCWICVGADISAIVVALSATPLLRSAAPIAGAVSLRSTWWALWLLAASGPPIWAVTFPDPIVPSAIRALYRDGVVDVVEIADFGCPHCRAMHPQLTAILRGQRGVRLTRVIVAMSPERFDAIAAYYCAVGEGQGDAMADSLFRATDFTRPGVIALAVALDMDGARIAACMDEPGTHARVLADSDRADAAHIQGVPVVYIEDRELLGFSETTSPARYREAIAEHGARRVVLWPALALLGLCIVLLMWGWRRSPLVEIPKPAGA